MHTKGIVDRHDRLFWSMPKSVPIETFEIRNDASSLDIGVCTEFELEVFPRRMTTWLGEILDTLVR